jgi:hypothetical protein
MRRWLYNNDKRKGPWSDFTLEDVDDPAEMSLRQLNFDVEALGAIAAKACGALECNEIEVIGEGRSDFVPGDDGLCTVSYWCTSSESAGLGRVLR